MIRSISAILLFLFISVTYAEYEIIFTHWEIGNAKILAMSPDGKDVIQLTKRNPNIFAYDSPRWSPDGEKIAFLKVNNHGISELWMMDANGENEEFLYKPAWNEISWSPNGKKIAFEMDWENIGIFDLETRKADFLVKGSAPVWSPDGNTIAYGIFFDPKFYFINPKTKQKWDLDIRKTSRLQAYHNSISPIAWSPDGKRIAFVGIELDRFNWWGIYVMDSDGRNVVEKLTGDGGNLVANWPSWSPNGRKIVFHTIRGIEIMDVHSNVRNLLYSNGDQPDWKGHSKVAVKSKGKIVATWGKLKS